MIDNVVIAPQEFEESDDLVAWNVATGAELWRRPFWEVRQPWECGKKLLCVNGLKDSELGYKTLLVLEPQSGHVNIEESDFSGRGFATDTNNGVEIDARASVVSRRNDDGSRWKWQAKLDEQRDVDFSGSDRVSISEVETTMFVQFTRDAKDGKPESQSIAAIDTDTGVVLWTRSHAKFVGSDDAEKNAYVNVDGKTFGLDVLTGREKWRIDHNLDWDNYGINGTTSVLVQDLDDKSWIVVKDDGKTAKPKDDQQWWFFNKRTAKVRHYDEVETWKVRGWFSTKTFPSMNPPSISGNPPLPEHGELSGWTTRVNQDGHLFATPIDPSMETSV